MTETDKEIDKLAQAIDEFRDAFQSEVDKVLMLLRKSEADDTDKERL